MANLTLVSEEQAASPSAPQELEVYSRADIGNLISLARSNSVSDKASALWSLPKLPTAKLFAEIYKKPVDSLDPTFIIQFLTNGRVKLLSLVAMMYSAEGDSPFVEVRSVLGLDSGDYSFTIGDSLGILEVDEKPVGLVLAPSLALGGPITLSDLGPLDLKIAQRIYAAGDPSKFRLGKTGLPFFAKVMFV